MPSHAPEDYCVLGIGRTGASVARWLLRHHDPSDTVWVYGGAKSTEGDVSRELEALGARVVLGTEDLPAPETDGAYAFDQTIVSPGISPSTPFFRAALATSQDLIGEPELAWRVSPERWVGITGTNGKTTTTTLVAHLLNACGMPAETVGNIGTPVIERVDDRPEGEWFVAELSSFQLQTTSLLKPVTACLLNITPDHVEWHGSLDAYAAAKERIFQNFGPSDLAVVSEDDEWCRAICERLEARGVRVCRLSVHGKPSTRDAAFLRGEELVVRRDGVETVVALVPELSIKGEHNAQNALAASAMALEVGVSPEALHAGLVSFSPLEHRIEPCGELDGVRFVNDSKATNTDSVEKALTAFDPATVILLMGGHDKGTSLDSLAREVCSRCKAAVCYGEAAERIASAMEAEKAASGSSLEVIRAPHMAEALDVAVGLAQPGDTVLLSPACSSFDEFSGFEERGRVFKGLVADVISAGGARR